MSYYYTYYIGYKEKGNPNGPIKPLGPFDDKGDYKDVVCKSRSFASDLHEEFKEISVDDLSKEFQEAIFGEDYNSDDYYGIVKALPYGELPKGDFIKSGYFLLRDIEAYYAAKADGSTYDLDIFYDRMTPELYGLRLANEMMFAGKQQPSRVLDDDEDDDCCRRRLRPCSDYAFFAYPDYASKEYECFLLRSAVGMLKDVLRDDIDIVIVETEG